LPAHGGRRRHAARNQTPAGRGALSERASEGGAGKLPSERCNFELVLLAQVLGSVPVAGFHITVSFETRDWWRMNLHTSRI
jgi:hypothetical protein